MPVSTVQPPRTRAVPRAGRQLAGERGARSRAPRVVEPGEVEGEGHIVQFAGRRARRPVAGGAPALGLSEASTQGGCAVSAGRFAPAEPKPAPSWRWFNHPPATNAEGVNTLTPGVVKPASHAATPATNAKGVNALTLSAGESVDRAGRLSGRPLVRRAVLAMIKRRASAAGLPATTCCHTFRATGITAYLSNGGTLEHAQRIAGHASPKTNEALRPDGGCGLARRDRAHRDPAPALLASRTPIGWWQRRSRGARGGRGQLRSGLAIPAPAAVREYKRDDTVHDKAGGVRRDTRRRGGPHRGGGRLVGVSGRRRPAAGDAARGRGRSHRVDPGGRRARARLAARSGPGCPQDGAPEGTPFRSPQAPVAWGPGIACTPPARSRGIPVVLRQ